MNTLFKRLLAILSVTIVVSCAPTITRPAIHLSALQPLPAPPVSAIVPLRVSVAAVISPKGTAESYQPLLDYLQVKLDRPVELVQRRTYSETNELVRTGAVDVAFVCTSAYITGHDDFGMELLAAPLVEDSAVYYSDLIVPATSTAKNFADLRGKVFAFTDPMSNTGRVYPTYLVQQLDSTPAKFFARTFFTYSHDDAIRAVALGIADGAAVDSLVYEYALQRDPALAEQVRVIHRSPPFGIPPVVVGPGIRPQQRALLEEVFLNMKDDPDAQAALKTLGIDGFTAINDSAYDSARILVRAVGALTP